MAYTPPIPLQLHALRIVYGLTDDALCAALGVPEVTLWLWEYGAEAPTAEQGRRIAALHTTSRR